MLHAAFASLSASNPQAGQECSRTHTGLSVETATLDDPLNPGTLAVELSDGVGSTSTARIDSRWSLSGNDAAHCTDDRDRGFRFDCHTKPDAPSRHVHPPPAAPSRPVGSSCIIVSEVGLVTRAILQRWQYGYTHETFE
jgi:hypothetical protein